MFDNETRETITRMAEDEGLEAAALLALAEVETAGQAFALVGNRREPIIRFEGHYFDRRLAGTRREQARLAGLASPQAGAIRNPSSQASRWQMLKRAEAIDRQAAYESVSWGLGQVMGAHWRWLGYPGVEALAADCRSGVEGQMRLMLRFLDKAGLKPALHARDWKALARGYNGPAFARNRYDEKLAAAHRRHRSDEQRRKAAVVAAAEQAPKPTPGTVPAEGKGAPIPIPLLPWLRLKLFALTGL